MSLSDSRDSESSLNAWYAVWTLSPASTSYYLNRLRNVKGYQRANMFTFNVIGPFAGMGTSSCAYDGGGDPARYQWMVGQTAGVEYEICAPDWATKLQDLGKTAFVDLERVGPEVGQLRVEPGRREEPDARALLLVGLRLRVEDGQVVVEQEQPVPTLRRVS